MTNCPPHPLFIMADGRRLWRIIENLYRNVEKYAMPNTRVYLNVVTDGSSVAVSMKNISEQPLNISAEELTERFTRGDESRTTEGSGLGLSIAKDLTELQGGKFEIYLDGDLFKVNDHVSVCGCDRKISIIDIRRNCLSGQAVPPDCLLKRLYNKYIWRKCFGDCRFFVDIRV